MVTTAANAHAPAATTFDPDTKYRLLLRVDAAEDLAHKATQGAYCKLCVGDAAVLDGSQKKLTKSASSDSNNGGDDGGHRNSTGGAPNQDESEQLTRSFRTQTRTATPNSATGKSETSWNETFEVSLRDPSAEILSLRVKSQHRFFCPVIGTFAVYLRHLRVGHQADQWFPLRRGKKDAGRIRLHLLITPEGASRAKKKRAGSDMAPDIKVALAANFEADRAIQRLVDKQLKDEEARRQRRLRGEVSDDDDDNDPLMQQRLGSGRGSTSATTTTGAVAALAPQVEAIAIAKVKEPAAPVKLGSNRGEARFAVLLPPSPSAQPNNNNGSSSSYVGGTPHNETLARLKQLDPISTVKDGRRNGDALGSGRGGARFGAASVQAPAALTSPVGSGPSQPKHQHQPQPQPQSQQQQPTRPTFFGADPPPATTPTPTPTASAAQAEIERNRRRAANFARLQDLDAVELGTPVASAPATAASGGSGRGGSRHSLPNTPSNRPNTSRDSLYTIPSFGPDDESARSKRHSAGSSTDSDSLASMAEYERRIDRKLRRVRRETEKLRKIKRQLRKYIPDLSESESESDSDASSLESPHRASNQRCGSTKDPSKSQQQHVRENVSHGHRGSIGSREPQQQQRNYF